MKGMELNLPQSLSFSTLREREKLPWQRSNYWMTSSPHSSHWFSSCPWPTGTIQALDGQWAALKAKTQTFKRLTMQHPGLPSGFQGNHSDCTPVEHKPYARASFNCCWPEGRTGRKRWFHFSGEQPQQQETQAKESHSWKNKEKLESFIACPRQVILNVFGGKPQDRNWLKANYWYSFY